MLRRRTWIGIALSLGLLALVDQGLQLLALRDGEFLGRPVAPFDPPIFDTPQAERLALIERSLTTGDPKPESLRFDAELGWCNPVDAGGAKFRYDWAGARIAKDPLARHKQPGVRRLAVFGCSMTHGDEVAAMETWAAQLDALVPALEVANMGVSAYGLDQAVMRQMRVGPDLDADEVWLVWMPQATLRITNLYRPLLRHWSLDVAFKPRFKLGPGGNLEAVASPARSLAEIPMLLHDQELFLERLASDDDWVKRSPSAYAVRGSCALHYSGLGRLLLTAHEATGRALTPHLREGHSTKALLEAIVLKAAAEAGAQGASFRLVILPGPDDLDLAASGAAPWVDTQRALESQGIEVVDLSAVLLAANEPYAAHGHLNPSGSKVAALALSELALPE